MASRPGPPYNRRRKARGGITDPAALNQVPARLGTARSLAGERMALLSPSVALVTGAGRGIGLGIARALAESGRRVALADLDEESAAREAARLRAEGREAIGLALDVVCAAAWERAVAEVSTRWQGLDVLVNNAGISPRSTIESTDEALWDRTLGINLRGPWLGIRAALPWLRRSQGAIINIGSTHATLPMRGLFAYTVSKAGLLGLTRQVAIELLDDGVTCNMIAPGWVASPGEKAIQAAEGRPDFPAGIRNMSSPEDVGAAVLFLISEAARRITGELLHLDGGLHAFGDVALVHFPRPASPSNHRDNHS
ncbi:MAG: SDR family oxidoreductase [Isosphaeraceae bacterium]|nr:SDR family oxidoreductase [Isosphaeraceae bacterium]